MELSLLEVRKTARAHVNDVYVCTEMTRKYTHTHKHKQTNKQTRKHAHIHTKIQTQINQSIIKLSLNIP